MRTAIAIGRWALALGVWAPASTLAAQSPQLQVYLVTIGQGEYVWEKFGHNALWFVDPGAGVDIAYNWGMFDFNQPQFLQRFLTGDTRYWVEAYPGQALVDHYQRTNRTITLQRLNFTPDQARRAYQFSQWNAREENKYYRYDYFRDNCSTRLRDVIDLATGGAFRTAARRMPVPHSFRSESLRLVDDLPFTQFGIDLALGRPADREITLWDAMFVPMRMRDAVRLVQIPRGNVTVPLVAQERVVFEGTAHVERTSAPALWLPYLLIGLLLAAELFSVGHVGARSRVVDVIYRTEVALWAFVTGLLGLILLLAWAGTQHVFWFRNENLLLANPLSLFLALAALLSVWKPRFARGASAAAIVIAALGVVALALKVIPGSPQDNLPVILLLLPPHVAIAAGLWQRRTDARAVAATSAQP
ncbi:MAG: DUF4105 domain-containing protein [Gemmatimonadaceae bacterium]